MQKQWTLKELLHVIIGVFYTSVVVVTIIVFSMITQKILTSYTSEIRLEMLEKNRQNLQYRLEQVEEFGLLILTDDQLKQMLYHDADLSYESLIVSRGLSQTIDKYLYLKPEITSVSIYCDRLQGYPESDKYIKGFDDITWMDQMDRFDDQDFIWMNTNKVENQISYIMKFTNSRNELQGFIEISLDDNMFRDYIDQSINSRNESSAIILFDRDEEVMSQIYTSQEVMDEINLDFELPKTAGYEIVTIGQKAYLLLYTEKRSNEWQLLEVLPQSVIYASVANVLKMLFGYLILILVPILPLLTWISKIVGKPIEDMIQDFKKVETEGLEVSPRRHQIKEFDELFIEFSSMNQKLKKSIKDLKREQRHKRDAELNALQSQINPHFFYNTLDMVNWMAISKGYKEISVVVVRLSRLFRISLSKGNALIRLNKEVEHAGLYIQIQQARFYQSFSYEEDVDPALLDCFVPKICIQPFVENSIVHGFDTSSNTDSKIKISAKKVDELSFLLMIEDNGKGLDEDSLDLDSKVESETESLVLSGYGVKNVNERVKMYFGPAYGVSVRNNLPHGTRVEIKLPIINSQEVALDTEEEARG